VPKRQAGSFDVAVVGGGVIGLAITWRAAQRGLKTVLLERDQPGKGTSHVAAGMLAPICEADLEEQALLALGVASARAFPAFVHELEAASELDAGYLLCGTLVAARDADEAQALDRELEMRTRLGLEVRRWRPSQARRAEPSLAPSLRLALEVPDDHAIDPRRLTAALLVAAGRAGAEVRAGSEVAAIRTSADRVRGVALADGSVVDAEQIVVAAGPWSGALGGLPDDAKVAVRPVKGQIVRLHDPSGPGMLTRVVRTAGGYIVPRGDGRYVLGATTEERGFDAAITAGAIFELLRDASELVPAVSELIIDELSAGFRPGTRDNSPAIGPGALTGLHWATGHYRNGILLTPITAQLVVSSLMGETLPELAAPFTPTRFAAETTAPLSMLRA
jgi:glycine oxidase